MAFFPPLLLNRLLSFHDILLLSDLKPTAASPEGQGANKKHNKGENMHKHTLTVCALTRATPHSLAGAHRCLTTNTQTRSWSKDTTQNHLINIPDKAKPFSTHLIFLLSYKINTCQWPRSRTKRLLTLTCFPNKALHQD